MFFYYSSCLGENKITIESIKVNKHLSWVKNNNPYPIKRPPSFYLSFSLNTLSEFLYQNGCIADLNDNKEYFWMYKNFKQFKNKLKYYDEKNGDYAAEILCECKYEFPFITKYIRRTLKKLGRNKLIPYINSDKKLCRLRLRRPDIYNEIFTASFIDELKQSNSSLYKHWYKCFIGYSDPVFLIRLRYMGKQNVRLTQIMFDVISIGQVLGGASKLDIPTGNYLHDLEYKEGIQVLQLDPPIIMHSNNKGNLFSFNLALRPKFDASITDRIGRSWFFTMSFCTNDMLCVKSNPMEVIMSRYD